MSPPQYERVSQDTGTVDPLASTFGPSDPSRDAEWTDDRSSVTTRASSNSPEGTPETALGRESPSVAGAAGPSTENSVEGRSSGATSSSSQPSRWGGLLDMISRSPSTAAAVTDGVFGNLVAKEENSEPMPPIPDENDDITPEGMPPTYEEASADATPSYWETTIMACSYGDEIIVGHMPVGSIIIFAWNLLISSAFSYIGFLITYLFHTTHAAKSGSIVGFGITLVQSSYDMAPIQSTPPGAAPEEFAPTDPNSFEDGPPVGYVLHPTGQPVVRSSSPTQDTSMWFSNCVFALGILLVLKGVWDYSMALRMEAAIKKRRREQEEQTEQAQREAEQAVLAIMVPGVNSDPEAQVGAAPATPAPTGPGASSTELAGP